MAKLTRKSYKRKKIAFAAVILGGVALVSSGFAAWVLSANATGEAGGTAEAGVVVNGALTMTVTLDGENAVGDDSPAKGNFSFNPVESDKKVKGVKNRVYFKDGNPEKLSLDYVVTVKSKTNSFDNLNVKMALDTEKVDGNFKKATGTDNKAKKPYVIAPTCMSEDGVTFVASECNPTKNEGESLFTWTKTVTISFAWGDAFKCTKHGDAVNENPCYFYEDGHDGSSATIDDISEKLTEMHDLLDSATFKITFEATAE